MNTDITVSEENIYAFTMLNRKSEHGNHVYFYYTEPWKTKVMFFADANFTHSFNRGDVKSYTIRRIRQGEYVLSKKVLYSSERLAFSLKNYIR